MQKTSAQILGVPEDATPEQVQLAHRRALQKFIARKQAGDPPSQAEFEALEAAYSAALKRAEAGEDGGRQTGAFPAFSGDLVPGDSAVASRTSAAVERPAAAQSSEQEIRFEFTGSGSEYFRIWIVNLFFSLLTLGIYSAWAKVRRLQYFHRNTLLDGSGFDYHGDPKAILKGRLIVWGALFLLTIVQEHFIGLYLLLLVVVAPFFPWLMQRSFRFSARNSSFRALHFNFTSRYLEACQIFLGYGLLAIVAFNGAFGLLGYALKQHVFGLPLLTLAALLAIFVALTFGLCYWAYKRFQFNHLSFCGLSFETQVERKSFLAVFLRALLFLVATLALGFSILYAIFNLLDINTTRTLKPQSLEDFALFSLFILLPLLMFWIVFNLVLIPYILSRTANLVWNETRLGPRIRFQSNQRFRGLFGIMASNWLLTLLTLGLYRPWAAVRLARYRAEHLLLIAPGSLDEFVSDLIENDQQALGEELTDALDFDIAL